jgi:hypothetical protein
VRIEGRADTVTLAEAAQGLMRSKMPLLAQALTGLVREQHRQLLAIQLADRGGHPALPLSDSVCRDATGGRTASPYTRRARPPNWS